jgi:choline dehydrogenase-like flavoprotein
MVMSRIYFTAIPHGNPAGVVMMVAEKLAEQIMIDYGIPIPSTL